MNIEEFCRSAHWGTLEDITWALENGARVEEVEKVSCAGWGCANNPACPGHEQVVLVFPAEPSPWNVRIVTLTGESLN